MLLLIFSFLAASGFWGMLRSLAYIYFFPFVVLGYFVYLCALIVRRLNRLMVALAPEERNGPPPVKRTALATAPTNSENPAAGTLERKPAAELLRFLSRPFRRFTILWGVLLLVTTHSAIVWICLITLLLQLARKIFAVLKVMVTSDRWLKKYGPLLFAGLSKALDTLNAVTPDADPGDKVLKGLLDQLNLWRRILDFLKDRYLMSRWAWVLAVAIFGSIYTYFSILFSFAYFGIARLSGLDYSWPDALVTSMFIPFFIRDLPKVFAIRLLGGLHDLLILTVGVGTVMNFFRRRLDAVRRAATTLSNRFDDPAVRDKYLILEGKFSNPSPAIDTRAENGAGTGPEREDEGRVAHPF
jgi:hypothetical protein